MGRRFVRDWFTGEVKEVKDDSPGGRQIIARENRPFRYDPASTGKHGGAYDRPWESETLAVPIEQISDFNEAARRNNTGAYYKPSRDGQYANLCCDSRGARAREFEAGGKVDRQGGYGDYTGR